MANKTTTKKKPEAKAPAKKAAAKPAPAAKPAAARGPHALVIARHTSKEALAKSLAGALAREDEDTDIIAGRLSKASNQQLLRLQQVAETVKKKFGGRDKLIAAIGTAERKSTDKDYLAKLDRLSLPNLLELATAAQRRARA
jgi:NAD(P)-dependent dehydrogenase (short-subunit alcohol dehydrogenase family)